MPKYATGLPLSTAAKARFHLLIKPASPGTPISASEDTVKMPNTKGILYPMPFSSCTYCFSVWWMMAPAQKKEQILITAWKIKWVSAPTSPKGVMMVTPNRM